MLRRDCYDVLASWRPNMDVQDSAQDTSRRKYESPRITEVKLRPEEAVLGNCKFSGGSGPLQASCDTPASCSSLAS